PSMGSVCEYLKDPADPSPAYVYMPCYLGWGQGIRRPGPYAGFLGSRFDPLFTECEPFVGSPPDVPYYGQPVLGEPKITSTKLNEGVTFDRLSRRKSLLTQLEAKRRIVDN